MDKDLGKMIREAAKDGKLPCAKAFKLAEEHGVSLADIGKAANEEKIKIGHCQLGCFQ